MDDNKIKLGKNGSPEADALLKRGYLLLDDGEWEKARKYFSRSLDLDPENAQAYLGRLMSHLKVKNKEDLKDVAEPFDHSKNYANIMRFGDAELKDELSGYNDHIKARNAENAYNEAKRLMDLAKTEGEFNEAAEAFKSLSAYKDSAELAEQCRIDAQKAKSERLKESKKRNKTIIKFAGIGATAAVFAVLLVNVVIPQVKYNNAVSLMDDGKYDEAEAEFRELGDFGDSREMAADMDKAKRYNQAVTLMNEDKYNEAADIFKKLDNYRNSAEQYCEIEYNNAVELMNDSKYSEAAKAFEDLNWHYSVVNAPEDKVGRNKDGEIDAVSGDLELLYYKDSEAKIKECEEKSTEVMLENNLGIWELQSVDFGNEGTLTAEEWYALGTEDFDYILTLSDNHKFKYTIIFGDNIIEYDGTYEIAGDDILLREKSGLITIKCKYEDGKILLDTNSFAQTATDTFVLSFAKE